MKRLRYVIPLSLIVVLVFAARSVAQDDVPKGQEEGQEPSQNTPIAADGNTTGEQNSTTLPAKKNPAETDTTPAESATPAPSGPTTVDISNRAFNPAQLKITPGTTVRFVNSDTEAHTATADNDLFDTGELKPGESLEIYFEGTGSVTYHCELHPDMKGSIVVSEAPNSEPSSEADEQDTEAAKPQRGY